MKHFYRILYFVALQRTRVNIFFFQLSLDITTFKCGLTTCSGYGESCHSWPSRIKWSLTAIVLWFFLVFLDIECKKYKNLETKCVPTSPGLPYSRLQRCQENHITYEAGSRQILVCNLQHVIVRMYYLKRLLLQSMNFVHKFSRNKKMKITKSTNSSSFRIIPSTCLSSDWCCEILTSIRITGYRRKCINPYQPAKSRSTLRWSHLAPSTYCFHMKRNATSCY